MVTPAHIPPAELPDRCFTTAEAAACGVTRSQLLGPGYVSVCRNVWATVQHVVPTDPVACLMDVLPAFQLVNPKAAASHTSAALLLGLRLPGRLRTPLPGHVTHFAGHRATRLKGWHGHRENLHEEDCWLHNGIRVTGPVRTVVDLAGLSGPRGPWFMAAEDIVAMLDGVINQHRVGPLSLMPALRSPDDVEFDLKRLAGRRGVARVRSALEFARPGVDSAAETRARLVLMEFGLGEWLTDVELHVPGHRAVWPDLANPDLKISLQIEGPHHDADAQRVRDIERQRATEAAGWIEIRVLISDLYPPIGSAPGTPPRVVELIRQAIARRAAA
ncbi:hypothetical protein [Kocuria sp. ZOR0020]|uniref:hypothetical protein n=1 Tax=Kocuria sp. ZOR0020 TaxID=1339234 RepID=UPI000648EB0C|nr:hypothetical protein [Kocuria sp. ZOR0020]